VILLCGIPSEPPLRLALEAAEALGLPSVLFNQREAPFCDIALDISSRGVDGILRLRETDWRLAEFAGVYVRLMDCESLPEHRPRGRRPPEAGRVERSRVLHEALNDWLELAACRVANRPGAMGSNVSKPYQSQLIARCGLRTPPTLITNDAAELRAFLREYGRVIFKSVSSVRSIVRELTPDYLAELDRLRHLPTQFQALIDGDDVRVHVVGQVLFATEVASGAIDYRYAARDGLEVSMQPCELPVGVRERCLAVSEALDLPLCGIDLKRTPDGSYYCFEVNPSPAYSYYQQETGQPIAQALVRYLAEG
jgi:hypothetical protein